MLPVNCLMEPWWIYCTWFNITCILFKEEALSGSSIGSFNCELNGFSIYQNLNMLGLFIIYIFLKNQFTFGFVGFFCYTYCDQTLSWRNVLQLFYTHTHTWKFLFSNCGYSPYSNRLIIIRWNSLIRERRGGVLIVLRHGTYIPPFFYFVKIDLMYKHWKLDVLALIKILFCWSPSHPS